MYRPDFKWLDLKAEDLKNQLKSVNIEEAEIQVVIDAMKKKEKERLLNKHNLRVWKGSDGYWRTYLMIGGKRMMKKRASLNDLQDIIIDYYHQEELKARLTLTDVYHQWINRKIELHDITDATKMRYDRQWNQIFFDFGKKYIDDLEADDIAYFLEEIVPKYGLTIKAFDNTKTLVNGVVKYAFRNKLIKFTSADVIEQIDISKKKFTKHIKEDDEEVFTEEEYPLVRDYLCANLDMLNVGILLMFLTGIRVGELLSLKHEDILQGSVRIRRTQSIRFKADGTTELYVKDFPKTEAGFREVTIPKDYLWITGELKKINPFDEYVFMNGDKFVRRDYINRRLTTIAKELNITRKTSHKIRKTYASILLDNNTDQRTVAKQLGHSHINVTENHYHRNRRTIERRQEIISNIGEFRMVGNY